MNTQRCLYKPFAVILLFAVVSYQSAFGQYALLRSADREFNAFNYVKAVELYEKAYQKKQRPETAEKLAASYYHIRNYREAEIWYSRAANHEKAGPDVVLRYADVLRNNAKFREARAQYARYAAQFQAIDREELSRLYASAKMAAAFRSNVIARLSSRSASFNKNDGLSNTSLLSGTSPPAVR